MVHLSSMCVPRASTPQDVCRNPSMSLWTKSRVRLPIECRTRTLLCSCIARQALAAGLQPGCCAPKATKTLGIWDRYAERSGLSKLDFVRLLIFRAAAAGAPTRRRCSCVNMFCRLLLREGAGSTQCRCRCVRPNVMSPVTRVSLLESQCGCCLLDKLGSESTARC